jgi:hypothetical protein
VLEKVAVPRGAFGRSRKKASFSPNEPILKNMQLLINQYEIQKYEPVLSQKRTHLEPKQTHFKAKRSHSLAGRTHLIWSCGL